MRELNVPAFADGTGATVYTGNGCGYGAPYYGGYGYSYPYYGGYSYPYYGYYPYGGGKTQTRSRVRAPVSIAAFFIFYFWSQLFLFRLFFI